MEDLSAATLDDVKEFFRQYYTPNNLSLVIAGDFDPAETKKLVAKYFGDLPPGAPLDRPARNVATLDGERVVEVNDRVSLERVYIGWPARRSTSRTTMRRSTSPRESWPTGCRRGLNKALVYDKPLATQVVFVQRQRRDRRRVRRPGHGAARLARSRDRATS